MSQGAGEHPDTDRASGVAIVMSPRLGRTVVDRGHSGSRIVWVQLETAAHGWDVIVVNVYVPHHGRVQPSADDTFGELGRLFADFEADPRKRRACKVLMGDMNSRLARAYDYTGRKRVVCDEERVEVTGCWSVHHSDNEMGGKLRQLLLDHELFSAGTLFRPRRNVGGAATYVPFGQSAKRRPAGLDHVCVSRDWLSCVANVRV
eukprot:SAG11_NODE_3557_length_2374_cov_3.868571_2_plen_204_part_00